MIKLSKRLHMVSLMVRRGSVVADIGTDHAYLPVYLIQAGIVDRAIAADLRKMPLENARETVSANMLGDKITLILSDGLDSIPKNAADDIVFAGMGGDLISDILLRTEWIKKPGIRIIAQPQTHSERVREFFIKNGFEITKEAACVDDGRSYVSMCAEFTGICKEYGLGYEYYGELPASGDAYAREYLTHQKNRLYKRGTSLRSVGQNPEEAEQLLILVDRLNEILEDM